MYHGGLAGWLAGWLGVRLPTATRAARTNLGTGRAAWVGALGLQRHVLAAGSKGRTTCTGPTLYSALLYPIYTTTLCVLHGTLLLQMCFAVRGPPDKRGDVWARHGTQVVVVVVCMCVVLSNTCTVSNGRSTPRRAVVVRWKARRVRRRRRRAAHRGTSAEDVPSESGWPRRHTRTLRCVAVRCGAVRCGAAPAADPIAGCWTFARTPRRRQLVQS